MRVGGAALEHLGSVADFAPAVAPRASSSKTDEKRTVGPTVDGRPTGEGPTAERATAATPSPAARASTANLAASLRDLDSARLADMPPELRDAANVVITSLGSSPPVLQCITTVSSYRHLVNPQQAEWMMRALVAFSAQVPPSDCPASPITLQRAMELLAHGGQPAARAVLHGVALACLDESRAQVASDIAKADLTTLAHLSAFLSSTHPLRREVSQLIEERRTAAKDQVLRELGVDAGKRFAESFEAFTVSAMRPSRASGKDPSALADAFVARGRELLGRASTKDELWAVRNCLRDSSPLSDHAARVLATSFDNTMKDGYGRAATFDNLVEILRFTHGEVYRVCNTVSQRDQNTRPDFSTTLNRRTEHGAHPTLPLFGDDVFSGVAVVHPFNPDELFHEMGHAFECVCPDVLAAATAFRDDRAIGMPLPLNDLSVIEALSNGDQALHRALLEHVATLGVLPPLDNAETLHTVFDKHRMSAAIDKLTQGDTWIYARPFSAHEMAAPVASSPYMAKIDASGTTEVVSLGLEALSTADAMEALFARDADHLAFILGALERQFR